MNTPTRRAIADDLKGEAQIMAMLSVPLPQLRADVLSVLSERGPSPALAMLLTALDNALSKQESAGGAS